MNFTIHNDREYEPGMCSNGGHYGFWQTYQYVPASETVELPHYVREFRTTHEFGICKNCGDLCQSPQDYDNHAGCDPRITVEVALSDLLAVLPLLGEKAMHFDGPAFRVTVEE